ncbi:MAG: hypothetical protein JWP15_1102, partial [Alphaproteobacteria bacterium]|nr:hypothetical protein [Alphaproteobacteria bacterium]
AGGVGARSDGHFAAKLDMLDQVFGKGAATLAIVRTGAQLQLVLVPAPACASRFQLVPGTQRNAWSDGEHVSLTTALLDFVANDDELAVVLGHELAHNILEHRARLRSQGVASGLLRSLGRNARKVEATEIEADRFGLRLMDKAGFRAAAAEGFWRRFASASGLMLSTTHPGLKARLAIVRETEEAIAREHSGR